MDGTANGILTAEIMNWTGHLLVAPRSKLPEALSRDEAKRTGVYILAGEDPEAANKTRIYVGEGDSVSERLKMHAKDASKDFWTRVFIVTSKDTNLTKAHVRFLENRLVQLAKAAERSTVANGNEPSPKQLPESDVADMEYFLRQVQLVLPVVALDVFRPKPKAPSLTTAPAGQSAVNILELTLASAKHGISASAIESDGEVTILAGSTAVAKDAFVQNNYAALRQSLIADGSLIATADGARLCFATDVTVPSPSAAAAVIFNRNSNGRTAWKVKASGQTLKDYQDAQLGPIAEMR